MKPFTPLIVETELTICLDATLIATINCKRNYKQETINAIAYEYMYMYLTIVFSNGLHYFNQVKINKILPFFF